MLSAGVINKMNCVSLRQLLTFFTANVLTRHAVGKAQVLLITLTMGLFYSAVPVIKTAKWNSAIH